MREPRFTDAWCFGKEFDAKSKICRICLANKPCQKKFYKALGASVPQTASLLAPRLSRSGVNPRPIAPLPRPMLQKTLPAANPQQAVNP